MAEFTFFGVWEDSLQILTALVDTHLFTFVVDKAYIDKNFLAFQSLNDQIIREIRHRNKVYLWSKEYSHYPPYMEALPSGKWDIYEFRGGPALNLALFGSSIKDGLTRLGYGSISYLSYYLHPGTDEPYKPPVELKESFKYALKIISPFLEKRYVLARILTAKSVFETSIEPLRIGRHGLQLIESDQAVLKGYGKLLKRSDLYINKEDIPISNDATNDDITKDE